MPYEKAQRRLREMKGILMKAVDLAKSENVDLVLIAGDLWEEDSLTSDTVPFVVETLAELKAPVIIAPGNHDYYSPGSHYSDDILSVRFGTRWSDNVHIFRSYDFEHFSPPELEDVCVTGLAYRSNQPVTLRRLGEKIKPPKAAIRLAVIHGSRDDHLPPSKLRTLPFSDAELLEQPFDYVALGHYHARSEIIDDQEKVRGAYSGSACALTINETGPCGCLIGIVEAGGVQQESLVFHELDIRRIYKLSIDISGLQHAQALENKVLKEFEKINLRSEDIAYIELSGTYPTGSRISIADEFIRGICFHLQINTSSIRPEWSLDEEESLQPVTTEAIFRDRLRKMIDEAKERDDEAEAVRLQNALYYGLDALHGHPILPRQTE